MAHPLVASSYVLHRSLHHEPLEIVEGKGITFQLSNGKSIVDASAGPAVSCLGHREPEVEAAVLKQLQEVGYVYSGSRYTCRAAEELASLLLKDQPGDLSKAIFVNSGSEATDAALKLASQYWCERGQRQRVNFIARKHSYHGNTLGALSVSGHESRRDFYSHLLSSNNTTFVDPCYAYRGKYYGETDEAYVERLKRQLEDEILRLRPDTVAAFIAETVSGTTLGCVPAVPGYFKAVREVCDKYDILLILDEIMCGLGKTGTLHAWQSELPSSIVSPDIQTNGKALGGGFIPLSAVLLSSKIFTTLASGSGTLVHGHTFQAHPVACAAALAIQRKIRRDDILGNVRAMGSVLEAALRREIGPLAFVGDIRGRGLFWGVEFVLDPGARTPFPPDRLGFGNRVVQVALQDFSLNILGNLGKTGSDLDVELVILAPPYIITAEEVEDIVARLRGAILVVGEEWSKSSSSGGMTTTMSTRAKKEEANEEGDERAAAVDLVASEDGESPVSTSAASSSQSDRETIL